LSKIQNQKKVKAKKRAKKKREGKEKSLSQKKDEVSQEGQPHQKKKKDWLRKQKREGSPRGVNPKGLGAEAHPNGLSQGKGGFGLGSKTRGERLERDEAKRP